MKHSAYFAIFLLAASAGFPQSPAGQSAQPSANLQPGGPLPATPDSAAWDVLKQGLEDNDAEHRKTAIAAIGTIGPQPQAVKLVEKALQDKDAQVRQTAAATLGQMGARDAIPNLKSALEDSPEVSFTAAKALWDLGDPSGREIFQEVIEGERTDAPGKLHGAMRDAKKKLTPGQMALMGVKETSGALLGPASIGVTAIEAAMKETKKDAGAPGRVEAAGVLAKDQDPYALTLLEWALADKNWAVRLAVAKALGERGNEATIAKLTPLLNGDRHAVRYMAAASTVKLSAKGSSAGGQ